MTSLPVQGASSVSKFSYFSMCSTSPVIDWNNVPIVSELESLMCGEIDRLSSFFQSQLYITHHDELHHHMNSVSCYFLTCKSDLNQYYDESWLELFQNSNHCEVR